MAHPHVPFAIAHAEGAGRLFAFALASVIVPAGVALDLLGQAPLFGLEPSGAFGLIAAAVSFAVAIAVRGQAQDRTTAIGARAGHAARSGRPIPVDTQATIRRACRRMHGELVAADATVVVDRLPPVIAQDAALEEILVQAIGSALQRRVAARRVVIRVSATQSGTEIALMVRDNGRGVEPGTVARLYDGRRPAVGLGRAGALARRMDGRVWMDTEAGEGSVFGIGLAAPQR